MKKSILALALILLPIASHAADPIPGFMIGSWKEATRYRFAESITFKQDQGIVIEQERQVGSEGTSIPYPTVCRFRYTGVVTDFKRSSQNEREYFANYHKLAPTYTYSYDVKQIELIGTTSLGCIEFIKKQLTSIERGGLRYSPSISDQTDSVILDPWTSTVFLKQ